MLLAGEVTADQRISSLFPAEDSLANGVENATLEQLATHASGLPRLALDFPTLSRSLSTDPYAGSNANDFFHAAAKASDFQLA